MKKAFIADDCYLGIELGSTRIKACLIDGEYTPVAAGGASWENQYKNGYFTYDLADIHDGIRACYADFKANVIAATGKAPATFAGMGISGMMHGYLAFDKEDNLLTPFRTWRNTTTEPAATALTELFGFNVPLRWSISHLYQAILNGEEHTPRIAHITTLAGYIHYLLTGRWEIGVCEASGMFPVNADGSAYHEQMLEKFNKLIENKGYSWRVEDVLPAIKSCADNTSVLTETGARFLDPEGDLKPGVVLCPPEGDAGTGMVATNAVRPKTGNVSAGTSVFSMLVLDAPLKGVYPEIDVVSTPSGHPVAMVHGNNGCSELDLWVKIFGEFAELMGKSADLSELYAKLYTHAMTGSEDADGIVAYNHLAAEPVAKVEGGCPMYLRTKGSKLTLASFFRSQLYATIAAIRLGTDILTGREQVTVSHLNAHGGLFKVKGVAAQCLADALNCDVTVMESAAEGGAWGMALLAAYTAQNNSETLDDWLDRAVFSSTDGETCHPTAEGVSGFNTYLSRYEQGLAAQRAID